MICSRCGSAIDPSDITCSACGMTLVSADAIHEGFRIASRYEVRQSIGAGGMGVVYLAYDHVLEEDVAIKVLRPEIAMRPDMARRFRQEIRLARKVRHRNVCGIHEYGEVGDLRYIAMEYVKGVNLRTMVREGGALDPAEAFTVSTQVARGLQAIHEVGIIHRDLKTSNIMLDPAGVVRLMDFGIAKEHGADVTLAATGAGFIVGTPEYMSPEQARAEKLDFRSDLYSLGVVVYEIFTGTVPFRGDTPIATLLKHLSDPPPLTGPGAPRIPESLVPVLARTLAKAPEDRYGEARELVAAIREAHSRAIPRATVGPTRDAVAIAPEPLPAPDASTPTVVPTGMGTEPLSSAATRSFRISRWPRWLPVVSVAVLLAMIAGGVAWQRRPRESAARGTIVINALPWGEVEQIVDGAGRRWPAGPDRYTPFMASLPPGDYVISVRHPDVAQPTTLRITVRASQLESRVVAFQRIDAHEYLEKAGL
jgi:predicted Ser/Thr protein kinase